ncbi:uncharacterized protein C9orf152-like [Megalops cyprinoides]|uniref:uncharacterized protein C9orf152-like n=1 Tax=Megalops cyprinoides TaxID=118141 RepID=UPI0018653CE4|nr:uncharacterized protein C9orf152-like [Megalops cyprinoides]
MDIALLKEQYNWIKEKQKLQTRVVLFKKAPDNEEICGKALVNMVPVSQEVRNPKAFEEQMPVKEIQFNFVDDLDNDKSPWRTHLGIHRMACTVKASDSSINRTPPSLTRKLATSKDFSQECTEPQEAESFASAKLNGPQCIDSGGRTEQVTLISRKLSTSEALSRQLSAGAHRPSNSQYYPFPQRRAPKKSEAARRLGMYSSF